MGVFSPKSHILHHFKPVIRQKMVLFAEFGSEKRPIRAEIDVLHALVVTMFLEKTELNSSV